jgi:hypothetical protein
MGVGSATALDTSSIAAIFQAFLARKVGLRFMVKLRLWHSVLVKLE